MSALDSGVRCDAHVGEVFPPRCADCDTETLMFASDAVSHWLGFIPGSECTEHPNYPLPCARCKRELLDQPGVAKAIGP